MGSVERAIRSVDVVGTGCRGSSTPHWGEVVRQRSGLCDEDGRDLGMVRDSGL